MVHVKPMQWYNRPWRMLLLKASYALHGLLHTLVAFTRHIDLLIITSAMNNKSTTGADASVEVPKLHNIKLLIASFLS